MNEANTFRISACFLAKTIGHLIFKKEWGRTVLDLLPIDKTHLFFLTFSYQYNDFYTSSAEHIVSCFTHAILIIGLLGTDDRLMH